MQNIIQKIERELAIGNYSRETIKIYLSYIKNYIAFVSVKKYKNKEEAIKDFLLKKTNEKLSPQTINLYLSAIKFFYREVLNSGKKINIKSVKRSKKIPVILSR